jgi:hypothetical protein
VKSSPSRLGALAIGVVVFETSDLHVASYVAYQLDCDPDVKWDRKKKKAIFHFEDEKGVVPELLALYKSGEARVEPREFFFKCSAVRRLMNQARPNAA